MKNLTKIFMAVVAVMLVSCIADTTTEPTVELGKVKTTIDLSFEGVKTHLGEKSDNQYPLLWSAGDQIAINGYISEPLAEEFDGKASASFDIESDSELTYPRSIVYPAPAEGAGVTFPATQEYKAGNIADGVAPLYGYAAEAGDVITLKHLTGILRFAVTGEATLASMTVKAEGGAIAGLFDVDFATGTLTAQDGKTSSEISMSFGEGLALSTEEATPLYIAVPAGTHGIYTITLVTTDNQAMTLSFNSDEKPIKAGIVREFKELVFSENTSGSDVFEIWDVDDLKTFAATPNSWKEVKLMENIVISTDEAWTSIEDFARTFNGNNKSISGLKAPLFGALYGSVKDLTLTDVAIVSNDTKIMGALANTVAYANSTVPAIERCSANGTLTIHNGDFTLPEGSTSITTMYGGLIGQANAASIANCTNNIDITVTQFTTDNGENTTPVRAYIGGVVGVVSGIDGVDVASYSVSGCTNGGNISIKAPTYTLSAAGVVSQIECLLATAYNTGNITFSNTASKELMLAGVVSNAKSAINGATNDGDILMSGTANDNLTMAGVVYSAITINTATNNGDVTMSGTVGDKSGLAGVVRVASGDVQTLTNTGDITISGTVNSATGMTGVIYTSNGNVNTAKNTGNIIFSGTTTATILIGGVAYETVGTITDAINGELKADGTKDTTKGQIILSNDNGATTVEFGSNANLAMGGIIANNASTTFTRCINYGDIRLNGAFGKNVYVGGITYSAGYTTTWDDCHNYGDITSSESTTITGSCYCGGMIGNVAAVSQTFEGCSNSGNITINGSVCAKGSGGYLYLGGFLSNASGNGQIIVIKEGFTNSGNITVSANITGRPASIGGLIGEGNQAYATTEWTGDILNTGTITYNGSNAKSLLVGGLFGKNNSAITASEELSIKNIGNVHVSGDAPIGDYLVGGIAGQGKKNVNGAYIHCDVFAKDCSTVGMFSGSARGTTSSGNIAKNCQVGGRIATTESEKKTWDDDAEDYIVAVTPDWTELNGTNYFNYIYSGAADWSGVEGYDGCSWLSEKPTVSAQ